MAARDRLYTPEQFEDFTERPENAERLFELIHGEAVEKVPGNSYASEVAQMIAFFIRLYLREHGIAGHITGEQGGYKVRGERYAPDVGYISKERQPTMAHHGYNPNPPELAVEVEYPTSAESERRLRAKLLNYIAAGVMVWVVYAGLQEIEVYVPGQPMQLVGADGTLDGGLVLPGFTLAVKDIFVDL
jgi:Uma2 family endonuclease